MCEFDNVQIAPVKLFPKVMVMFLLDTLILYKYSLVIKKKNFLGDVTDVSARKAQPDWTSNMDDEYRSTLIQQTL